MDLDRDALIALLPLIVLAADAVAVMLAAVFVRPAAALTVALAGLLLALAAIPFAATVAPREATVLLTVDGYALFYWSLIIAAAIAVIALCGDFFRDAADRGGALYVLLVLATLGAATLAASSQFASFLLGLEVLSVSLIALIAFPTHRRHALEAAVKYLVLAGGSSAFLLFGMALVYARLGTMEFARIGAALADHPPGIYLSAGLALIFAGIAFKLAVVPFHMWIADVYEGAPPPVAAFVATVSKGAVVALLMRYFVAAGGYRFAAVGLALSLIAIVSILAGNLLALLQDNIKRVLAYSSVAHLGYLLVAFLANGALAAEAVGYYLTAYFVTMIAAFGVVGLLARDGAGMETIDDCRGLFWRRPWPAAMFAAALLSLAGIPMTMGFVGKFYVVAAGAGAALWGPVFALVIGSTIALFYYLRIIAAMADPAGALDMPVAPTAIATGWTLAALAVILVALGVYPAPLVRILEATVAGLG
ncbi:MAG: NADH-quinone oxidoreductase subunit N [Rhodocyclaceae bacterium]|nr:NADH-quinone oxidoreductase subunit N [Rhodocyclaceae bacterium]